MEAFVAEDEEGVVLMETLVEDVAWVNAAPEAGQVNGFSYKGVTNCIYYCMMRKDTRGKFCKPALYAKIGRCWKQA